LALQAQLHEKRRLECQRREQDAIIRNDSHGIAMDVPISAALSRKRHWYVVGSKAEKVG